MAENVDDMDRMREVALAGYGALAASGGLETLDIDQAARLASAVARSSDEWSAVAADLFGRISFRELLDRQAERDAAWEEMKASRFAAMTRAAGASDEEAGRAAFDRENGDPSGYLKLKEAFYYG